MFLRRVVTAFVSLVIIDRLLSDLARPRYRFPPDQEEERHRHQKSHVRYPCTSRPDRTSDPSQTIPEREARKELCHVESESVAFQVNLPQQDDRARGQDWICCYLLKGSNRRRCDHNRALPSVLAPVCPPRSDRLVSFSSDPDGLAFHSLTIHRALEPAGLPVHLKNLWRSIESFDLMRVQAVSDESSIKDQPEVFIMGTA
jgi:hypothetical protein